ncbi:ABC transporter [Babesia microti strain RI]|uniref:ABC transporter n=1 Tax=Babesia microti (strain RI) TaxID=1133968 RepID=A0A1R4AB37_BABMR|nr:ABC transporter [Babesia microti strain RI]SJK86226.1 ABC transporter [Babesia microti strain RI]|eukprot:XP_021338409.1 ABC transporter [Babesia microti strain RI]
MYWNIQRILNKELKYVTKRYVCKSYIHLELYRYNSTLNKPPPQYSLLKMMLEEPKTVGPAILSVIFSSGVLLAFPRTLGRLLNDLDTLNLAKCIGLVSLAATASFFKTISATIAMERIATRLRTTTFNSLLRKDSVFFDKTHSTDLANLLSSDITIASSAIHHICTAIRMSITSVFGAGLALYFSPPSLFAVILTPATLGLCLVVIYGRYARKLTRYKAECLGSAIQYAQERLSSIKIVKAFNAQNIEEVNFKRKITDMYMLSRKVALAAGINDALSVAFIGFSVLLISHLSASTVANGIMNIGDISSLLLYTVMSGGGTQGFITSMGNLQNCLGAASRVLEHLHDKELAMIPVPHIITPSGILFDNVKFAYPTRPKKEVLGGLTLNIPAGAKVAIMGKSGSGKSTIIQLLMKLYVPTSGEIYIDGKRIDQIPDDVLRSQISWISQEYPAFSTSIRQNITYPLDTAQENDLQKAYRLSGLTSFIDNLPQRDLTFVGEGGRSLSGGERQRINLARLFLNSRNILALDEPTASLDNQLELEIVKSLKMISNRTVLLITHRTALIDAVDFVITLTSG